MSSLPSRPTSTLDIHRSILLDLFRLVQLHNGGGDLSRALRDGPAGIDRIVADIAHREAVANAARATKQMSGAAREDLEVDEVAGVLGEFVDELRG